MDSIRGFDSGFTFDIYAILLKDLYVQSVIQKMTERVDMTSECMVSTHLKFNDAFEIVPGFDMGFGYDSLHPSKIVRFLLYVSSPIFFPTLLSCLFHEHT
jgi:hypothetical protein